MGFLLSIRSVICCCHATHTDRETGMHVLVIFSADFFHANVVEELCDGFFPLWATIREYFYSLLLFSYKQHQMHVSPRRCQSKTAKEISRISFRQ